MKCHKELKEYIHLYCKSHFRTTEYKIMYTPKIQTLTLILCIEERLQVTEFK